VYQVVVSGWCRRAFLAGKREGADCAVGIRALAIDGSYAAGLTRPHTVPMLTPGRSAIAATVSP
jgi:hypothetical protein